jgi:hypothetical protein
MHALCLAQQEDWFALPSCATNGSNIASTCVPGAIWITRVHTELHQRLQRSAFLAPEATPSTPAAAKPTHASSTAKAATPAAAKTSTS